MRSVTGGDDGLYGITRTAISLGFFKIPIVKQYQYYFVVLFFFVLSIFLTHRIYKSPFGLVLAGIRENHVRTEFAGLAVKRYRLGAFVVSGAFAGLAGALAVMLDSNITPFAAHWSHSVGAGIGEPDRRLADVCRPVGREYRVPGAAGSCSAVH